MKTLTAEEISIHSHILSASNASERIMAKIDRGGLHDKVDVFSVMLTLNRFHEDIGALSVLDHEVFMRAINLRFALEDIIIDALTGKKG